MVEADRTVSLFNPAAEHMFGAPSAAALGRQISDFIPYEYVAPATQRTRKSARSRIVSAWVRRASARG